MIAMDLFYLKNLSILLDLKIMLKTCAVIAEQLFESRPAERCKLEDGSPRSAATPSQQSGSHRSCTTPILHT
jgi:hypothetical protein